MSKIMTMKLLYIILFCFLTIGNVQAQESWVTNIYSFGNPSLALTEVCGDTIIQGETYEKIYVSNSGVTQLEGGRRIVGDTVFFLNFSFGSERILYDYSLEVGDYMELSTGLYEVIEVSSGIRKQITLQDTLLGTQDVWIQGIGSTVSNYIDPGNWAYIEDYDVEFVCYHNAITGEQFGGPCILDPEVYFCQTSSVEENALDQEILIYPNPATDHIYIDLSSRKGLTTEFTISNASGKLLLSSTLSNELNRLTTEQFVPGLYFMELRSSSGQTLHKIMIE